MTRRVRLITFAAAAAAVGALFVLAALRMPAFGGSVHPYRTLAVEAALAHHTSNAVSAVNFDLRGLDTLGEESILLASVLSASVLLRPADDEERSEHLSPGRILDLTAAGGYVLLPLTVLIGLDVVAHGHLTPGGGFQGGVIIGTGLHLLYVAGRYGALRRIDKVPTFELGEAFGASGFAVLGVAALAAGGAFLTNVIPTGRLGTLFSGGTVPLLNGIVGVEVASGTMVLLAKFLEQALLVRQESDPEGEDAAAA